MESERIEGFQGNHRFLSNFWPATVTMNGVSYPTVEHAYQAAKTSDISERNKIRACATPGQAKRIGRSVKIQPGWDDIRLEVMEDLVREKFRKDSPLRFLLLNTGNSELVESNDWGDRFWGVCRGIGDNHLGKILMKIREELRH